MEYYEFRAMNCAVLLAAEGQGASDGFEAARAFIEAAEERFSRFRETSELTRLNHSAGEWFHVSADMYTLLELALDCYAATDGLFNPSILPDLRRAGYTRSMDELRTRGADPEPADHFPERFLAFDALRLDRAQGRVLLPKGMQIDLGGIAKGWIAERAAELLSTYSPACAVSAGGDMFMIGHPQGETGWNVGLEDPRDPSRDLIALWVDEGAVVTSSVAKRTWQQGTRSRHHLIDPRSGEPAESPWLSVTVFSPHAAIAEAFAKAILIGGPAMAQRLIGVDSAVKFLAVDADGQLWDSAHHKEPVHAAK
jgi:thiamine biosynthesis lipoprotein